MLIYAKRATGKTPKRRSRGGCIHCKERKKKCNEKRPECSRCSERGLQCQYEAVKPRRAPFAKVRSALAHCSRDRDPPTYYDEQWPAGLYEQTAALQMYEDEMIQKWEASSAYHFLAAYTSPLYWDSPPSDDMEETIRTEPLVTSPLSGSLVCVQTQYPDVGSPLLEFSSPVFMEFSPRKNRRALIDHFCNVFSHLIVFKEDTGNPFRQLLLPLSHVSPPVMNAILALSSAHLEYRGVENEEKSLDFHNRALQGLAQLIDQSEQANKEEVLGAIMLLVYYEALVQRENSSIVNGHLKAAMTIIESGPLVSTPTTLFLERAFHFYDVIAALSLGTSPNTSSPPTAAPLLSPSPSDDPLPDSPLTAVDTLLGASTDLWPTLHRLAHLLSAKTSLSAATAAGHTSKASILHADLERTSLAIELALTTWTPRLAPSSRNGSTATAAEDPRIQGIRHNAEAYRHSALVHLYRAVRCLPRSHPLVQKHAHLSLRACSRVVQLAEQHQDVPLSALLWPLFVAACEAATAGDRMLAEDAFAGLERRQGMRNIVRAWEVAREVWRRADLGPGGEVDWRGVCEERGFRLVFG